MTQVTVFGGSGFIGRHLVEHLARAGASVRVATRHPSPTGEPPRLARIQQVEADILDDVAVQAAVHGADTVINLVGILSPAQRHTFTAIHEDGARRVAASAKHLGVRHLVHVSALGASRTAPALADRSKAAGEEAVRAAFPEAAIVRPSLVFGSDDHFFNGFAARARRLPALPLIGGGQTRFQPVYVEDVVAGFAAILANPASRGKIYEFGGPRIYTFKELLEFVCATIRARPLLVPVPFWAAELLSGLLQVFPGAPLTHDQVRLLRTDKVVSGSEPTLGDVGIEPKALETIVPEYLSAYRR
ncbi:hypothetical protein BB934_33735 (plasmid) [Microvirga ossetica]|uniref:NAD-dependent epimerase/dehydratase domain-containing protein n=1 Tax=Microvirga ossetica TaxID=1882682 RepID=A0A1B2ET80_9HYPH|nr:complex I NDUFA9 subunit family protein [Microvirga ossetica]ANY83149.1 hypothetical protein BB934_33735 [Microvirga ossetica]